MNVSIRVVSQDEADIRLDRWFRRHFPASTQGVIQKLCRTGQVRVDGHRIEAATRLQPGQTVRIPPMKPVAADRPIAMPDDGTRDELERMVLYRDAQLIVLNKPFGLPVQGGPGISRHLDAMLDGLRFGHPDRPRLVHRLDRDTSGVLVLARSPGVAARIAASFRGRDVQKTYWAVVAGRPVPVDGRIEADLVRIGAKRGERTMVAERGDPEAAHAITDYRTLDHAARRLAWLELRPLTGRTHQLRVHCMSLGTPVLGDEKYGIERNTDERGPRDIAFIDGLSDRLHLHARGIRLPHPEGGTLEVEAALPPHMRETFATVGFEAAAPAPPVRVTI